MISLSKFHFFDPLQMKASILPDKPGNYLVILRSSSLLPQCDTMHLSPKLTSLEYSCENYQVIYTGSTKKSLRYRIHRQHLQGNSGISTLRKSIGCLMGLQLIFSSPGGKSKFSDEDEERITDWMMRNLGFLCYINDEYQIVEKELISTYHPPLNLQNNNDRINADFRETLSALRSSKSLTDSECNVSNTFCPNCNISLVIMDELKDEEYLKCLTCGHIFKNPVHEFERKSAERTKWKWPIIFVTVVLALFLLVEIGENGSGFNNQSTLSETKAMAGVRIYLKYNYLKDPDSYKSMKWGPAGIYNKENNTYFMMHKFRAKNSYGGYVIEEWLFVLNADGEVIQMKNDIK